MHFTLLLLLASTWECWLWRCCFWFWRLHFFSFSCFHLYRGIAIFLVLPRISFHDSATFVIYSDSWSALQALGSLYTRYHLVLGIQRFLWPSLPSKMCLLLLDPLPHWGLWKRKGWCFGQKGLSSYPHFYFLVKSPVYFGPSNPGFLSLTLALPRERLYLLSKSPTFSSSTLFVLLRGSGFVFRCDIAPGVPHAER